MTKKISAHVDYVGVNDPELRKFDVVYETRFGTTYNSYLVRGPVASALVDTVKNEFSKEFLENLRSLIDLKKLDYVVINHVEPDHSGALEDLLREAPQARVVSTKVAAGFLREILNREVEVQTVGTGDSLPLGGDLALTFYNAPFLHWPETMFTYLEGDKVLFPCDFFGSHYGEETVTYRVTREEMEANEALYFKAIMKPFSKFALEALGKIQDLSVEIICPSHGPVHMGDFQERLARYRGYAAPGYSGNRILVGYLSCYGYTRELAEAVDRGIQDAGIETVLADLSLLTPEEAAALAEDSMGLAVGSATINRDVIHIFYDIFSRVSAYTVRERPAATFGSYGWSGEAVKHMGQRLEELGYQMVGTMRTKLKPDPEALKEAYELGAQLAKSFA